MLTKSAKKAGGWGKLPQEEKYRLRLNQAFERGGSEAFFKEADRIDREMKEKKKKRALEAFRKSGYDAFFQVMDES